MQAHTATGTMAGLTGCAVASIRNRTNIVHVAGPLSHAHSALTSARITAMLAHTTHNPYTIHNDIIISS